ncbi:MAG: PrsW family glutamic-type intramembrane protease [Marinilabiliales bacterium]|nr:PrsW family glutamic-type intramembrane protease [Marinilabiliales bacterium]
MRFWLVNALSDKAGVVILVAIFFSVLIPLMEELIKPLAVWLLAGRLDSAAQGFAFGALGGAGFGLIETLNVSGQITEWGLLLFTRIGTGLLHIATSAIMGAAILWRCASGVICACSAPICLPFSCTDFGTPRRSRSRSQRWRSHTARRTDTRHCNGSQPSD